MNLPVIVLGRPAKPVSLFFTAAMLLVVYLNLSSAGIVGDTAGRHLIAAGAGLAAALGAYGWFARSQRAAEWALLAVSFVWAARFWAGGLSQGFELSNEGVWFSLCWCGIAAGSFWLERTDSDPQG